jgi:hypothetical protein
MWDLVADEARHDYEPDYVDTERPTRTEAERDELEAEAGR